MSESAETILTPQEVTNIIAQAKSGGVQPILIAMQIFNGLADAVTLSGETLRLSLNTSATPIPGSLAPLVSAIQSISKTGGHIAIAMDQETEVLLNRNRLRFEQNVTFDVNETNGTPALSNIGGVAAHKLLSWINIQSIQLKQNQGRWSVAVGTSLTTINFDLDQTA